MQAETLVWLESQKPTLVKAAEKYLKLNPIFEAQEGKRKAKISNSQLRNLLAAAQNGSSIEVLINFLRYQIGRGGRGWPELRAGDNLISELERLLADIHARWPAHAENRQDDLLTLEAKYAAQYLGFLIRDFTYRCKVAGTEA